MMGTSNRQYIRNTGSIGRSPSSNEYEKIGNTDIYSHSSQPYVCRGSFIILVCISICCCTSSLIALYMAVSNPMKEVAAATDNEVSLPNQEPPIHVSTRQRPSILLKMAALIGDEHTRAENVSISKIFPKWHKHHKSDISDVYEHEVIKDMSSFKDTET